MPGHVRKRGNKYYAVLYLKDDRGNKKQKWFSGFTTRKSANEFIARKILESANPNVAETIEKYLETWFSFQQARLRPSTIRSYQWLINRYIVPKFGSFTLPEITPQHIQTFYSVLIDNGLSYQTVLNLHRVLKNALNRAVLWGRIQSNPATFVQPPRVTTPIFDTWTPEQLRTFLDHAKSSRYYIAFLILASTGMRLGELQALRWSDFDMENGVIRVRRTLTYTGKRYEVNSPKTRRGIRAVSLPETVVQTLTRHWQKISPPPSPDSLICETKSGQPVLQHNLRMLFYTLIERSGVPKIRVHDLRHTHASLLLSVGINPKVLQERLGHASVETTLNIYSHVLPHMQEGAAKAFEEFLN